MLARTVTVALAAFLTLGACSSGERSATDAGIADAGLPPGTVVYSHSVGPLPVSAGSQAVYCTDFHLGNDGPISVIGYSSTQTTGGHHLILVLHTTDTPDSPPTPCDQSASIDPRTGSMIYISQITQDTQLFPPTVGIQLPANASMMLQVHYIDASQSDLQVSTTVNVLAGAAGSVTQPAAPLLFYAGNFTVPPGQSSTFATCVMSNPSPYSFFMLAGHMHSRGTNLTIDFNLYGQPPQQIYQTATWDSPREEQFDPPLIVRPQSQFTWTCDYTNTTSQTIKEPDEMCAVLGNYYPAPKGSLTCFAAAGTNVCGCVNGAVPDGGI